jgi:hypothetical protein
VDLHLVEDNSVDGPHQIINGNYSLAARISDEILHVFMSVAGASPDTAAHMGGFYAAWQELANVVL